jgi:excalibur calcium-binding domain-containing protein
MNKIISFAFLAIFVFYGFHRCSKLHPAGYLERNRERTPASVPVPVPVEQENPGPYACKGKTRCPQMESCEEARFYLANCPGVEIDGDGNGIPCEKQWCGR